MDYFSSFSKWFYRAEGNKSIVISNPSTRKVLRFRKVSAKTKDSTTSSINIKEELSRNLDYSRDIFVPLLGKKYVHPGTLVDLPKDFVLGIRDLITSENRQRPLHRLSKEVKADCELGVLLPDVTFVSCPQNNSPESSSPTFCVEIKPKLGFLPHCGQPDESNDLYYKVKQSVCKYCLFQWQKVNKERKYHRRSGYCPLDLFSNDIGRVMHALACLVKDPQNNLRIFRDGTLVYSGETNVIPEPSNNAPPIGKAPPINPTPLANNLVPDHDSKLLDLEKSLKSSFITNCNKVVPCGNLFGDDNTGFQQCTLFILTLLQLLVDDSNNGCTVDHDVPIPNQPVCVESHYNDSTSLVNDIQSQLDSSLDSSGLTFGKTGILNRILNVQKLDKLGSDKVFKIYEDVWNNTNLNDILCTSRFTLKHPTNDGVDVGSVTKQVTLKYFEDESSTYQSLPSVENLNKRSQVDVDDESSISSKLNDIVKFLIAATTNDCSIMISFQQVDNVPTSSTCYIKQAITGLYFKYSIAVVDLDPKSFGRIPKYYREYHEIIENYLHYSNKNELLQ